MTLAHFVRHLLQRSPAAPGGPCGESGWARLLRWNADRRHLLEMEDRLLQDVGLTRADVTKGIPFAPPAPVERRQPRPRPVTVPAKA